MTNKLDIINHMLNVIGESPVSTVSSDHPSVLAAMVEYDRVDLELQNRGWWFNTEYNLKLSPDVSGNIIIPSTSLFIQPLDPYAHLVQRGSKLYDPVKHTFAISAPVFVNVVLRIDIEDIPTVAMSYIKHKSAYDFYVDDDGDEGKSNRLEKRVTDAWAKLNQEELRVTNVNAKHRPSVLFLRARMQQTGTSDNPRWPGGKSGGF